MIRRMLLSGAAAVLTALAWSPAVLAAQDHSSLMGAWVVEASSQDGTPVANPQPGLFIFTSTHYSLMFVPGGEPRVQYAGDDPTDADRLVAYGTIIANSGRYEVSGDQLTTRAYVAKDPNYMGAWPENQQAYTIRMVGDRLHLTAGTTEFTLRRVEGTPLSR